METNGIFRQKSIDRVTAPDELDDYIKVANPGTWLILVAVIALLAAVIIWGIVGRLNTTVSGAAVSDGSTATVYISEKDTGSIEAGMTVEINGSRYTVESVGTAAVQLDDEYALHLCNLGSGAWVFPVEISGALEEGVYPALITVESVAPMSFVVG